MVTLLDFATELQNSLVAQIYTTTTTKTKTASPATTTTTTITTEAAQVHRTTLRGIGILQHLLQRSSFGWNTSSHSSSTTTPTTT
jgi:hypothetical protein